MLSETSYNWESEDWIVPLQLGASNVVRIGGRYLNVGATLVTLLEAPDSAPDWELRLNVTYVFP